MSDNSLTTLINDLVEQKTFSLEALSSIKELRDKATILENQNEYLKDSIKSSEERIETLKQRLRESEEAHIVASAKINTLKEREKKATESIYQAEKHKAVAEAYKDAMTIVFKPNVVREAVAKNVPVSGPVGFSTVFVTENIERTEG